MYNLQINELTPGRKYYVKVRAKAPDLAVSEWSPVFEFTTSQDTVPPHIVRNLTFKPEGDSFIAKWDKPEMNADGTPCNDLTHYAIKLTDIERMVTVHLQTASTNFTLDINSNVQLFGQLAGRVKIEVAGVDNVGNTGAFQEAIAQNPAPNKVLNVVATAGVENIGLTWDLGTETDISHYEIHVGSASNFTPGALSLRGQAASGTNAYSYQTASLSPVFFKIIAVDKFNQKSVPSDPVSAQPLLSTDYDKTPPGVVSGLAVTQSLAADNASAVAKVTYTGLTDADLDKYEIQYRKTGETVAPWSFAMIPSDQTSAEIRPLPLSTSYDFKIRAVDFNSNKGAWSAVVVAPGVKKTTLPAAPTGVTVRGGTTNLMVTWTASTDPSMANWAGTYEVQISKATTFTSPITIKTSSTLASFISLDANTVYYVRVRSIDPYGNTGAWSTTANGNTGQALDPLASRIYWSDTAPTGGRTNDVWIKTPENVQYRYNGTTWVKAQDTELAGEINNVRQTADGKNKAWYQTTKPPATNNTQGDLWFDTANGNKLHVWSATANDWVSAQDQAIQDADGKFTTVNQTVAGVKATADGVKTLTDGWKYQNTTYINGGNIQTDTITAVQIASKTITAEEIKGGTITATEIAGATITANEIKGQSISGDKLAVNTAIANNLQIQSALTINAAAGHIKSSNWNDTNKTGFYMDQQQLIVHNGRIEAAAIKLQDSSNIMPPTYASFNARESAYAVANMWTGSVSGTTKFPADGKFGGDSLQAVITANTGFIGMGHSDTDLNIPIDGGKQYIISFYVSNRSSKVITLQPELYQTASILIKGTATSIANSTAWTRYSMVVTAPATMTRAILRFNLTAGATATFRLDGIQVEQKIGQETAPSNWSPPGFTSIDGESITTGSISSVDTISTPNGNIARWSIDTKGAARFADAVINGKLIVGGEVSNKEATSIQSDTYAPGLAGWAIKGNGDVEFNDGTFRGVLNLGRLTGEALRPTMAASVSNINLYTDAVTYKPITVASIRGLTYAYTRQETGVDTGVYEPIAPDQAKIARYFIGPTTDRSVNIQVHDAGEDNAVFLDAAPVNVTLSSVKIGELTNTSSAPLEREKQGFGHTTQRAEKDPSTPDRISTTSIEQDSSVRLRSASYPEISGGNEYPDSTHRLAASIDFKAPVAKNMLYASHALPDETAPNSTGRESSESYSTRAYALFNDYVKSTSVTLPIIASNRPVAEKKHIFSTYIDTIDATDPVAVYAFVDSKALTPIGEAIDSGQTAYQHSINYHSPDYRYEFESASSNYTNVGSSTAPLARTHGDVYTGPPGAIYNNGNTRYTATENYSFSQGMSISMWMYPTSSSGSQVIFHRAADTSREIWINYEAGTRTLSGGLNTGTAWTWVAESGLVPNAWTHVTIVIPPVGSDTGRNIVIYINGEARWPSDPVPSTRWNQTFGTQPYYVFGNMQLNSFYQGAISELMFHRRMLTAAEVENIFNSGNKVVYLSGGKATLSQNGILVSPGRNERVAFEYTPTGSSDSQVTLQVVGLRKNLATYAHKLQLERAKYMEDMTLPSTIRELVGPTPWTTDGSVATGKAELILKTTPAPDQATWSAGAQTSSSIAARNKYGAAQRSAPTEMELTLTSSYRSSLTANSEQSVSTTYKWTPAGVAYPGVNVPYMPTAASIVWDYAPLTSTSRPQIGGSTNWSTIINTNSTTGQINIGVGLPIRDDFNRTGSAGNFGPNWINTGDVRAEITDNYLRRTNNNANRETGITHRWSASAAELGSSDQEMEVSISDLSNPFERWPPNVSILLSLDPTTESRVEFRYVDYTPQRIFAYVVINGQAVWSASGEISGGSLDGWTKFSFARSGRSLVVKRAGATVYSVTVPSSIEMPTGKSVGFHLENGALDSLVAYDRAPGGSAYGLLLPQSINVNNQRGLKVTPEGQIMVEAPGYYMVSATIKGDTIGAGDSRDYWIEISSSYSGVARAYNLSNQVNSTTALPHISGTHLCYLHGSVSFIARSNTTTVGRISYAEMHIARVM